MSQVFPDVPEGEVRLLKTGDQIIRVFKVVGLGGAASHILVDATRVSGMPRLGDAHPALPAARVTQIAARPGTTVGVVMVDVSYASTQPAAGAATVGGWTWDLAQSFITEQTIRNVSGGFLRTSFSFVQSTTDAGDGTQRWITTTGERRHRAEVQRPTISLRFHQNTASFSLAQALRYKGAVNGGTFQGQPADRWLCSVNATGQEDGTHRVTFEFAFKDDGWQPEFFYSDNGVIPEGVTDSNGISTAQLYRRADFNAIGLPRV